MSTVLFAWELGRGIGHLTRHLELVRALLGRGHRVVMAVRDLAAAERIYGAEPVALLPAPFQSVPRADTLAGTESYADILYNQGFGDAQALRGRIRAWREIFACAAPAVVVFDHSPTALLASRRLGVRRILSGSGFFVPPRTTPLPALRYWEPPAPERLEQAEARVLGPVNGVLDALGEPRLGRLAELLAVDEEFLLSFPELDHYPQRAAAEYLGVSVPRGLGHAPAWPPGAGPRVFAYVHASAGLGGLLQALEQAAVRAIVCCPELQGGHLQRVQQSHVALCSEPLDLVQTAREADLGITNATLGTTTALLLAGKPMLLLPDTLERRMVAHRVLDLGAAILLQTVTPGALGEALQRLAAERSFAAAAEAFARHHAQWRPEQATQRMLAGIEVSMHA